jgi:acetolactate synthase-1/2/3 large subunit
MGIDPFLSRYPVRGYPCDIPIVAHPSVVIPLLTQGLAQSRVQVERTIVERLKHIKAHHEGQEQAARERLTQARDERPIEFEWVSPCMNQVKDDETILMNESDLNLAQVQLTQPGSYYAASPAAGLGCGLGAALGMKLAAPTKTVIATVGEGACMVGCPTAKRATKGVYPNGWAAKTDTWPLPDLMPSPSFERMADVHDAYGELVEDPAKVLPALRRGLNAVHQEK